jgi:glycosyltransferase involved in cell wall biosynthesis
VERKLPIGAVDPSAKPKPRGTSVVVLDFATHAPETVREFEGAVELVTENHVVGWARDPSHPDRAVEVELWADDRAIASTIANMRRDDLAKAGIDAGNHGFLFKLGAPLGNISVRIAGTAHVLEQPENAPAPNPRTASAPPVQGSREAIAYAIIDRSGLFDRKFYLQQYSDVARSGIDPLRHYCELGHNEQRRPNFYFDRNFYAAQIAPNQLLGGNLLPHFISEGERGGYRPSPYFDTPWYRAEYRLAETESALAHYLRNCRSQNLNPVPEFDADYYVGQNPDVRRAGVDPFQHYLEHGWREGRDPSPRFGTLFYILRHLGGGIDQNPLLHYLAGGKARGLATTASEDVTWASEVKKFTAPGPLFEPRAPRRRAATPRAKLLAFYLPQYHAFPENDLWWGKGFTEWTNVIRGAPRFKGHYQPRAPRDLGFYNLTTPGVMRDQIDLARDAGVFGFIFYFYSFGKRRLMEAPLENFLADPSLDFPFCLMWANEDWTRTWDGVSSDVLIAQEFSAEDDAERISTWLRHFRDPRYIHIEGRPLLMIYRPGLIPKIHSRLAEWRERIRAESGLDPIFVMGQGFGDTDPTKFGFDGAVEFPPHKIAEGMRPINASLQAFDFNFSAAVFPYEKLVERSVDEPAPDYPLIKSALPGWDNDARRQGAGMTIHGSTPAAYQDWLERLIGFAERNPFLGEKIVCVNAWNEWAEGAYLEPDLHFGSAYLNATARAVFGTTHDPRGKICLVGHDAHPHGAQLNLKSLADVMARGFGLRVEVVLLEDGKLFAAYREIAPTTLAASDAELRAAFRRLYDEGFRYAILNSTASSRAAPIASAAGLDVVMLVHELPSILAEMKLHPAIAEALPFVRRLVFPAEFVRRKFLGLFDVETERTLVRPQGSYSPIDFSEAARGSVRRSLGVDDGDTMVLGVGFADLRKGFDFFLQAWRCAEKRATDTHFVWVGDVHPLLETYFAGEIGIANASGRFHMIPFTDRVGDYYSAADIYLLTSREDPFPTVVLEALRTGIPVIAFEGSGGIPELLRRHDAGVVAPMADLESVADALPILRARWASTARDADHRLVRLVHEQYFFPNYAFALLGAGRTQRLKISVVVPNYNYARHLKARLASIFEQVYPIFELIVLDDGSTDSSLDVLAQIAEESGRIFRIVPSAANSGSVFRQWRKAVELASGDYIWIAEADDMAAPRFLERLAGKILESDEDVTLAYADSRAVDENDVEVSPSYKFYYRECAPGIFDEDQVFDADAFVGDHLSERNLILNVSACLWRRSVLLDAIHASGEALPTYRLAGDWHLYVTALSRSGGKVVYVAEPLNVHRRHDESVTRSGLTPERHIEEIRKVQLWARDIRQLDEAAEQRQDAYLREVADTLGVRLEWDEPTEPEERPGQFETRDAEVGEFDSLLEKLVDREFQ